MPFFIHFLNDNMSSLHHSLSTTMEEGATSSELLVGSDEPHLAMEATDHPHNMTMDTAAASNHRGFVAADQTREMLFCVIFFGVSWIPHVWSPHERPIPYQYLEESNEYVRNLDHDEQFVGETVSDVALILLAAVLPLVLQLSLSALGKDYDAIHATICVYFTAFGLNALATESVKLYVGYLRPIFYDICEPNDTYQACSSGDADDVRKSFPSGHASQSFCGLTLLSLFLHARFGLPSIRQVQLIPCDNDPSITAARRWTVTYKKHPSLHRLISVLSLLPMALALFIAVSRVRDNKHFPADVVGGSVLGGSIAIFTNSLWFAHSY